MEASCIVLTFVFRCCVNVFPNLLNIKTLTSRFKSGRNKLFVLKYVVKTHKLAVEWFFFSKNRTNGGKSFLFTWATCEQQQPSWICSSTSVRISKRHVHFTLQRPWRQTRRIFHRFKENKSTKSSRGLNLCDYSCKLVQKWRHEIKIKLLKAHLKCFTVIYISKWTWVDVKFLFQYEKYSSKFLNADGVKALKIQTFSLWIRPASIRCTCAPRYLISQSYDSNSAGVQTDHQTAEGATECGSLVSQTRSNTQTCRGEGSSEKNRFQPEDTEEQPWSHDRLNLQADGLQKTRDGNRKLKRQFAFGLGAVRHATDPPCLVSAVQVRWCEGVEDVFLHHLTCV